MAQQLRTPTTVAETLSLFLCTRGLQLPLTPLWGIWYSLQDSMGTCIHVEYTGQYTPNYSSTHIIKNKVNF